MFRKLILMLLACSLAAGASAVQPGDAPDSRNALAKRFKEINSKNDCDGLIDLFYTQGVDDARRGAFTITMTNYVCANFGRPVTSIAFQVIPADQLRKPKKFNNTESEYTIPPEGAMVIDYGMSNAGQTTSISLLYGKFDSKYYLITTRQAAKQ